VVDSVKPVANPVEPKTAVIGAANGAKAPTGAVAANLATSAHVAKPDKPKTAVVAEAEIPAADPAAAQAESATTAGAGTDAAFATDPARPKKTTTAKTTAAKTTAAKTTAAKTTAFKSEIPTDAIPASAPEAAGTAPDAEVPTGGRGTTTSGTSAGTSSGQSHPGLDAAPTVSDGAPTVSGDVAPTVVPGDAAMRGAGSGARHVVRIVEQRKAPRVPGRPASQPFERELVATPNGSSPADGSATQTTAVQEIPRQPQRRSFFRRRRR
jgi:hypothetical protein